MSWSGTLTLTLLIVVAFAVTLATDVDADLNPYAHLTPDPDLLHAATLTPALTP